MNKIAAALLLSLGIASAQAVPIVFTSSTYATSAVADVDGVPDADGAISPPDALPIASLASVTDVGGSATANATADSLSLAASTAASSTGGVALASATATFFGEYTTPGGPISLSVNLDSNTAGPSFADVLLAVILVVDDPVLGMTTLLDQFLTGTGVIEGDFLLPAGLPGTLEIVLSSNAGPTLAVDGDEASNESAARFAVDITAVPEPATLAPILFR